jgi:hypothetical protein
MSNTASKLKLMDLGLKDEFLIHLFFASLPKEYRTFVVNYNLQPDKWDIEKLIAMYVQEEERLKSSHGDLANHVKKNKKTSTTRTLNHKENLSGTIAPPLSNKERSLRKITIRNSTMFKWTKTPADGATRLDTTRKIVHSS